ncbi:hypothetical protein EDL81_01385 [Ehrlichia ruminantium]|uniref:Cpg1 family polymorphic protein n=1 Tax=Ehrlichia ruminantium TaxID=779 RepID=UPI00130D93D8|nr:hypothetical protein [Ehrlichia ruminantium]QGR02332.1 hypothetical protein EDL81_01385 [Ehrlichia ruminantium]
MARIRLNRAQELLLRRIRSLISDHTPRSIQFFRNPLRYIINQFNTRLLNRQNTVYESSLLVTEEIRDYFIDNHLSLEDLVIVSNIIENETIQSIELSLFHKMYLDLNRFLLYQLQNDPTRAQESVFRPEDNTSPLTPYPGRFDPRNLDHYLQFVAGYINPSNEGVLYTEAQSISSRVSLITPQIALLRALARAVLVRSNDNSLPLSNAQEEISTEFTTAISLSLTAATPGYRYSILSNLRQEFATQHPHMNRIINASSAVSACSLSLSFAYIIGIGAVWIVREYSEHAVNRARNDILNVLNLTDNNSTVIVRNRTLYELYINNTNNFTDVYNNSTNSTSNNATIIPAPGHSSEYFPENWGIFNGIPGIWTTILSSTQLLCALPAYFCSAARSQFINHRLQNRIQQSSLTVIQHYHLLGAVVFRWIGNVVMQPADMLTSLTKDTILKHSIFRLFLPVSFLEEPLKCVSLMNTLASNTHRRQERAVVSLPIVYATTFSTLGLEYLNLYINSTSFTVCIKALRPFSLLMALFWNRRHIAYSSRLTRYCVASISRLASSLLVLPLFDLVGDQLRYLSITGAVDVLFSVQSDIVASNMANEASEIQMHMAVIQHLIDRNVQPGSPLPLMLLAERARIRQQRSLTISQMIQHLEEEIQNMEQCYASPRITEVTDAEAEQILHEQQRQSQQSRSDLNAPSQQQEPEGEQSTSSSCCVPVQQCLATMRTRRSASHRSHRHTRRRSSIDRIIPRSYDSNNVELSEVRVCGESSILLQPSRRSIGIGNQDDTSGTHEDRPPEEGSGPLSSAVVHPTVQSTTARRRSSVSLVGIDISTTVTLPQDQQPRRHT